MKYFIIDQTKIEDNLHPFLFTTVEIKTGQIVEINNLEHIKHAKFKVLDVFQVNEDVSECICERYE